MKAITKGNKLSSVKYICLRDEGEQLTLREDGEPAQVGSGPSLFPLVKSAMSTNITGTDDTKMKLGFSRQWKTSCPERGFLAKSQTPS